MCDSMLCKVSTYFTYFVIFFLKIDSFWTKLPISSNKIDFRSAANRERERAKPLEAYAGMKDANRTSVYAMILYEIQTPQTH